MNLAGIVALMEKNELRLVTAESCTAGLIASNVADVPGAGVLLDCAFVTYSPRTMKCCMSVKPDMLRRHNLTSDAGTVEMAQRAIERSHAAAEYARRASRPCWKRPDCVALA